MPTNTRRSSSRAVQHTQSFPATSTRATRGSPMVNQDDQYASGGPSRSTRGHVPSYAEQDPEYDQEGEYVDENGADAPYENGVEAGGAAGAGNDEDDAGREGGSSRTRKATVIKDSEDEDAEGEQDGDFDMEEEEAPVRPTRGSRRAKAIAHASSDEDVDAGYQPPKVVAVTTSSGRHTTRPLYYDGDSGEEEEEVKPRTSLRRGTRSYNARDDFVEADDEYDEEDRGYGTGKRSSRLTERQQKAEEARKENDRARRAAAGGRGTRNNRKVDQSYEGEDHSSETDEDDEMLDLGGDSDDLMGQPQRKLREKRKVNYFAIPSLEAPQKNKARGKQRDNDDPFAGLPLNMTGAQWAALYPEKNGQADSSDDDDNPNFSTPRKAALFSSNAAATAAGFGGGGAMLAGGPGMGGSMPNNLGKVTGPAALADTDPLGVSSTVSFDSVGGLGSHIQQLKEMVSLPLLYPEVFERFNITPPRGVLFHGPPGTGKTLLARALAASCSTDGRKISFFMRKGADCLSKWVGEAERQLRLLFDEAKACQPSIIFFDEIDGLAPVRSSKQEQIHASIVSTLLALMDGMDGRGQVIVIGATNRPDAIDPALRRPGRFDREFYFPLPNLEGRRKILDIHTSGWNPPIEETFKDELAQLTKGYGGADLRALCTEAALNAVQRTYPQIYKTNERLLIKPETIDVTARDFVVSQKNLIPSSARATSSSAAPIPPQLVPLLQNGLEQAKVALSKVLPEVKRVNILEEAEWEDDGGGFEKERMLQAFETLRVFRPRMLVCGETGMGQSYVGAAVLHHLEGFHVQSLDLATLVADSSRTMEAACVQLFVEAKRHKPSILFIPSLITWCSSVSDAVKSTIKGLLEGLDPSDPILLLAVVDGPLSELPADVRGWFGFVKGNRVVLGKPTSDQRTAFFIDVLDGIQRPPNEFPDAMPRRKRVLEELDIAPPPPPRAPTAAEILAQEQNDQRLLEYLKWKLGPILNELKKRYKRFTRSLYDDWKSDDLAWRRSQLEKNEDVVGLGTQPYHNVDLDTMHNDLYKGYYFTPDDFLEDILRIQANAEVNAILESDAEAPIKAGQMVNHLKVMNDQTFDEAFRAECVKMSERMKEKEKSQPSSKKGRKGKGKELPKGDLVANAQAAASAGGAGKLKGGRVSISGPPGQEGVEGEEEDAVDGPRRLKRVRLVGDEDEEDAEGEEDDQGPVKRARGANGINGHDFDASEDQQHQPVASTSQLNGLYGVAPHQLQQGSSFGDLLHPAASTSAAPAPVPDLIPATPALPGVIQPTHALAPPMQVGALPNLLSAAELAGPLGSAVDAPFAGAVMVPPHSQAGVQASTSASGFNAAPAAAAAAIIGSPLRASTPVNVVAPPGVQQLGTTSGGNHQMAVISSPIAHVVVVPVREPTPAPLPDFILSPSLLSSLATFLSTGTDELNIDQLEQLRAACFDVLWRGRKAWERNEMVKELVELAREFVQEVEEVNASSA